jgi:hypothetical protein
MDRQRSTPRLAHAMRSGRKRGIGYRRAAGTRGGADQVRVSGGHRAASGLAPHVSFGAAGQVAAHGSGGGQRERCVCLGGCDQPASACEVHQCAARRCYYRMGVGDPRLPAVAAVG